MLQYSDDQNMAQEEGPVKIQLDQCNQLESKPPDPSSTDSMETSRPQDEKQDKPLECDTNQQQIDNRFIGSYENAFQGNSCLDPMDIADSGVVVSGISGRFPASDSMNEFQYNLEHGIDMVADPDDKRYPLGLWDLPKRAGRLKDLSKFDYEFFGYTKEMADVTDHQQRILHEVIYESIVDAGINPAKLRNTNTGLFLGLHTSEFENAVVDHAAFKNNGYYSQLAVKAAQYFGLKGHVAAYDAACASAFVALHNAIASIQNGLVDQAIVCGTNISIHPINSFIFLQMQMLSTSGYSRFLDAKADGYVKSEACVAVLLQRKQYALRNYTSILTSQCNVDGYKREGITFPSATSQEELIRQSKETIKLNTNLVEYIEAHGTGTPAGDPQEAKAISEVYCNGGGDRGSSEQRTVGPLLVGSIKTNMGHSEGASGLCSLAKVILMLEHEIIYKSLHFTKPNPTIESLMDGRLEVVHHNRPLKSKIIPMSCYGFGGANVHGIFRANNRPAVVQLSNAANDNLPPSPTQANQVVDNDEQWRLVFMFGRSEDKVNLFFDSIMDEKSKGRTLTRDFCALVDSLCSGPIDRLMKYRGVLIVNLKLQKELYRSVRLCCMSMPLSTISSDLGGNNKNNHEIDLGRPLYHLQDSEPKQCYFVYPGLGTEWPGMARGLRDCVAFWSTIERLQTVLQPVSYDLIDLLLNSDLPDGKLDHQSEARQFSIVDTFVGVTAIQIAMTNIVKSSVNVKATGGIIGHSLGEIACAYADEIFDERETILLAYHLSETLEKETKLIEGTMVAISIGANECQKLIDHYIVGEKQVDNCKEQANTLYISCDNGPQSVTVSGRKNQVDDFVKYIQNASSQTKDNPISCKILNTNMALHNPYIMNDDIKRKIIISLRRLLHPKTDYSVKQNSKWISTVHEDSMSVIEFSKLMANAEYFANNICKRVEFYNAIKGISSENSVVIEIGPAGIFESILRSSSLSHELNQLTYIKLMNRGENDKATLKLFSAIGQLFQAGLPVDMLQGALYPPVEFPVRRQVPSISSLLKWDHSETLFVPKYPEQFSKSSAKSEIPIDIVQERDKYLVGHTIEGRVLFPATGYLYYVWRVFSFTKNEVYDASYQDSEDKLVPIEFHNVRLHRAVILSGSSLTRLYINLEVTTGQFEVKEADSVVVDGWVRSPTVNPDGLMYDNVIEKIRGENLQLTLSHDDVYKSFRVNGYDYGETFRCIEAASSDGRFVQVKFNGELVALTDNILQSIFLAICSYAPTGGLFLPTRFDYVRFNPRQIFEKLEKAGIKTNQMRKTLDTTKAREAMKNMMLRNKANTSDGTSADELASSENNQKDAINEQDKLPVCIFDTYCELTTGIIVTDGVEMRGIRATPAPRRETNKPLVESYKFVPDFEEPVEDLELDGNSTREQYRRICDNVVYELIKSIELDPPTTPCKPISSNNNKLIRYLVNGYKPLTIDKIELYMRDKLTIRHSLHSNKPLDDKSIDETTINKTDDDEKRDAQAASAIATDSNLQSQTIKESNSQIGEELIKNQPYSLLSLYDFIWVTYRNAASKLATHRINQKMARVKCLMSSMVSSLEEHDKCLSSSDVLKSSYTSERFMRPTIETIIENSCHTSSKLRLMEINIGQNLLCHYIKRLIGTTNPNISLDYTVAHPNPKLLNLTNDFKTHTLKDVTSDTKSSLLPLIQDERALDAISYFDSSCYAPSMQLELNGLGPILATLAQIIRQGGFLLVMIRHNLSMSERFIMAMRNQLNKSAPSSYEDLDLLELDDTIMEEMNQIQMACKARVKLLLSEAERCKMTLISKRMDTTGCAMFLFQNNHKLNHDNNSIVQCETQQKCSIGIRSGGVKIIHVKHQDYTMWLDQLKEEFTQHQQVPTGDNRDDQQSSEIDRDTSPNPAECVKTEKEDRIVWLCAMATHDQPFNGLVGMIQCLIRELGSKNLRCFYDLHTFKDKHSSEINLQQIEQCANFSLALKRNMIWNCIDANGRWGSWRHITLSDYFDYTTNRSTTTNLCDERDADGASIAPSHHCVRTEQAYANVATRGDLSSFCWFQSPYKYLSDSEQKQLVKVHYSALNFRDVMLATGRLPLDALPTKLAMSDCLLGLEFAGVDLHTRKRVAGMVFGRGISTQVLVPNGNAIKFAIPDNLSLKEAATIPVVYATVIMAMIYRGKVQPGESILIHAGSGGVGQAAIRLSQHHRLNVFTTVGSEEKRQFLLEEFRGFIRPEQIFSSRDCSFEGHIMRATRGRGVDLILNSLADDKLQASVRCLADNGRFLEIGKYDLAMNNKLDLLKLDINKSFHGIVLDMLFDVDSINESFESQLRCVLDTLVNGLELGYIKPIKSTCFSKNQLEEAFRFMATGKHIGKVLIEIEPEINSKSNDIEANIIDRHQHAAQLSIARMDAIPRFQLNSNMAFIVTGGLGGFGLELIKWLVSVGARHFIVTSRRGFTTGYQEAVLERIKQYQQCQYLVVDNSMADGTTHEGVEKIFDLAKKLSPINKIGGVFHLAMVLKDSLLDNMTSEHFELVCKPKADTCQLLDKISRKLAPEMSLFVAFSSVSCGKGNAGQANYGYANSVMERICEARRNDNLHGLAIQWGAIGDVGTAYENLGGNDIVIGGTIPQRMSSCFATLATILCSPFAICSSIVQVDQRSHETAKGDLVGAVLHVLGIKDATKVSEHANLGELGLDSLMAVEIRQYIEREYELTLNVQEIRALTIAKIREIGESGHIKQSKTQQEQQQQQQQQRSVKNAEVQQNKIDLYQVTKAKLNKEYVADFKPQLELPKTITTRLDKNVVNNFSCMPIFFIPPLHGDFTRMQMICQQLRRPCIGLNWTRQLGQVATAHEAARTYVKIIDRLNWNSFKQVNDGQRVVNLVGYSFGATIAFEMMTYIQSSLKSNQNSLLPGRLILLDGAPSQIAIGSQLMNNLSREKPLTFTEKVDELLLLYIVHHTRHLKVDYLALREKLLSIESGLSIKLKFTCDTLAKLLNITDILKREDLAHAIEAFCRRYEIISNYKTTSNYIGDLTLIRAKQNYMDTDDRKDKVMSEDYSLSKVVIGKVDLHILDGNHESFIDNNVDYICKIIDEKMVH